MLGLGFPKLKGMTAFQALKYSLALNHPLQWSRSFTGFKKSSPQPMARITATRSLADISGRASTKPLKDLRHPADLKKKRDRASAR